MAMVMRMAATESGDDLGLAGFGTVTAGALLELKTSGPSELVSAGEVGRSAAIGSGAGRADAAGASVAAPAAAGGGGASFAGAASVVSAGMRPAAIAMVAALGRSSWLARRRRRREVGSG